MAAQSLEKKIFAANLVATPLKIFDKVRGVDP
jgi:hypothetical protein